MSPYKGRVRIIERDEVEDVMRLCRQLHDENGLYKMSDQKVRAMLDRAFDRQGGILGGVGPKGKLEGLLYLLVSGFWYSEDSHLEELFLYVDPACRKSRNAVDLLQFGKWCAEQSGFKLFIGIMPNAASQRKVFLYDRQLNSDMAAEIEVATAQSLLNALGSIEADKNIRASVGNLKAQAQEKLAAAAEAIKKASTQKGYFFIYDKKAA